MKRILLTIALLIPAVSTYANNFNMPWNNGNNGSSWNMPSMNWGNNNNGFGNGGGSNWNMPTMNWGNGNNNGYGSNMNMPTMNWGNNGNGTNMSMPNMNWGNNGNATNMSMPNMGWGNNGNGTNMSMPNMGWGNNGNGTNLSMPNMNWGNNNQQPWSGGRTQNYTYMPRAFVQPQMNAPRMPVAPQFIPRLNTQSQVAKPIVAPNIVMPKATMPKLSTTSAAMPSMPKHPVTAVQKDAPISAKIPMPSEVKGVILAPENAPKKPEAPKQQ